MMTNNRRGLAGQDSSGGFCLGFKFGRDSEHPDANELAMPELTV